MKEYLHTGCHRGSVNLWTVGLKHEKIEIDVKFRMKYQLIQSLRMLLSFFFSSEIYFLFRNPNYTSNCIKIIHFTIRKICQYSKFIIFRMWYDMDK
jgi:hypothetical protein